jgi:uncharacterized phage-associated protein
MEGGIGVGNNGISVLQVAKYVTSKLAPITTMKLQKLCYYVQAWSLVWDGEPLFYEDFEAWANGPVCRKLYEAHKGVFVLPDTFFSSTEAANFNEDQIETIDAVLRDYGDKEPNWLSDLTHMERPWKEARVGVLPGERSNNIILKETMQDYYGGLVANG